MTRRNGKAPFEGVRKRGPNCDCKGWLLLTVVNLSRQQSTQSFFLCDQPTTEPCACTRLSAIHWNSVVKLTIASYLVSSPKWLNLPKVWARVRPRRLWGQGWRGEGWVVTVPLQRSGSVRHGAGKIPTRGSDWRAFDQPVSRFPFVTIRTWQVPTVWTNGQFEDKVGLRGGGSLEIGARCLQKTRLRSGLLTRLRSRWMFNRWKLLKRQKHLSPI